MRIILQFVFLLLILIVKIEDLLVNFFVALKKNYLKLYKRLIKNPKRKRTLKRKKPVNTLSLSARAKFKYFFSGILFSFLFGLLPLVLILFFQDLPNPKTLTIRQAPQTTKIYDRNGILLAEFYATQNRTVVPLSDIPKNLVSATLAIEDKNFYSHPGFYIPSIFRALREDLTGRKIQGGSTITQQLIKSSLLTPERSITRKIKEIVLAFWAEHIYTKQQILEMYFNQVPYGGTAWGIEAASEIYFDKQVKDLDLAESAFLAGITAAPTAYSPFIDHSVLWKKRQKEVLDNMLDIGFISKKQEADAENENLKFKKQYVTVRAPHFVNYIKDHLVNKYGLAMVEKGGLTVTTTLDTKIQDMTQKIVSNEIANDAYLDLTNGAALVTDPRSGDIIAMVGSKDFDDPEFGNVNITTSLRQPGSSIKVVTYSTALTQGFTAATILDDTPFTFPDPGSVPYSPVNYDGRYHGKVPLRFALANSLNLPAVKTLNTIGIPAMVNMAKKMGVTTWGDPSNYGLSLTLGAAEVTMLDMATVNGVVANGGKRVDLNPVIKIIDSKGNVLEEKQNSEGEKVLDEGIAFIISDILADNQARTAAFGINTPLTIPGHTVSVKTGTTDSKRDNWTNGFTNNYVVVTWVGNNDNTPMNPVLASGITGAAPIWHQIMVNLLSASPEQKPVPPQDIIRKSCYGKPEYFIKGTENLPGCNMPSAPSPTAQNK